MPLSPSLYTPIARSGASLVRGAALHDRPSKAADIFIGALGPGVGKLCESVSSGKTLKPLHPGHSYFRRNTSTIQDAEDTEIGWRISLSVLSDSAVKKFTSRTNGEPNLSDSA